jgi:hypothetical protein
MQAQYAHFVLRAVLASGFLVVHATGFCFCARSLIKSAQSVIPTEAEQEDQKETKEQRSQGPVLLLRPLLSATHKLLKIAVQVI